MKHLLKRLSLLAAASIAVPIYAQQLDVPSFVDLAMKGADIANRCAAVANSIAATKVPADHAMARARLAVNAAAPPSAKPLEISQENATYVRQINVARVQQSSCGKQLAAVKGPIQSNAARFFALMASDKMPRADAQKVAAALNAYNDANKKLVQAILALSNDRQVESYMADIIVNDFVEEAKK